MPYTITKDFTFSASHILHGLPDGHPCGRLHGHNYIVRIMLAARSLDSVGFVRDYGDLRSVADYIDQQIDHRHLNDALPFFNPTAEHLARHFFDAFKEEYPELVAVSVSETPKTWATYSTHTGVFVGAD